MAPSPEDQVPGSDKRSPLGLPLRVGEADLTKASRIWTKVKHNVHKAQGPHRPSYLTEMSDISAILPYYWQLYPPDFAKYLRQEICDLHMAHFLEDKKVLNWCPDFPKLYPLHATGDGNCLLHAISLALWGVEDSDLWLRKLLHDVMKGEYAGDNESRWRRERNHFDTIHIPGNGFRYNTKEWSAEWQIVVDISSPERQVNQMMGLPYECLEEFHIFVMANILRRPIIILAENMWRDAAGQSLQPMNFSGIYLPLAWDPKDCYHHPILLGYHQMHFSPLFCTTPTKEVNDLYILPLVDHNLEPLPIHFLLAKEEGMADRLLHDYLTCEVVEIRSRIVLCTVLPTDPPRDELDVFDTYMKLAESRYRMYSEEQHNPENAEVLKAAGVMSAITVQQLNEKVASGGKPKQNDQPRQIPTVEPLDQIPTENSLCISSTALKSSGMNGVAKNPQHTSYLTRTTLACGKPGCPYVRALESDEYCESCYKAMTSVGKEAFKKCKTETCWNSGDRRYGGLCQVCFDQDTFMNEDAGSVARPTFLPELSTSPQFSGLHARGLVQFDPASVQDGDRMDVDEDKTGGSTLDTNVVNEFIVGSKQCTRPGCEFTGNPKYDGLCSKCFQDNAGVGKKSLGGAESAGYLESSPPREIALTVGKQKCLMPECQLTGHPEKGDLCSGCFSKQAKISKATGLSLKATGEQPSSIPDVNIPVLSRGLSRERQKQLLQDVPQLCRTPKCDMFAHPSQNGFCSACYKKSSAGKSGPHGVSKGPHSPQRKHARDQDVTTFRPILQFTVEKNMCAMPGCNGVRLQVGTGELCRAHHQETSKRYSPTTRTSPPMGASSRAGLPSAGGPSVGGRPQPSAPPQSIYASRPGYVSRVGDIHQATGPVQMAKTASTQICAHPKCSSLAVAPTFVACSSCQNFVDKVNRVEAAMRDVRGEVTGPQPSDICLPPKDEDVPLIAMESELELYDPPTDTVRNLDIHEKPSSAIKGKFDYGYVKRVKCQAIGGCPYNSFGNPSYGNLCAKCFDRDVVRIHNASSSSSSAPLKKPSHGSSRTIPPRSKSAVISSSSSTATRTAQRPSNYQKCTVRSCENQANLQALEGYCNTCYPVYRPSIPGMKKKSASSGVQGRSTQSSGTSKKGKPVTMVDEMVSSKSRCYFPDCSNYGNSLSRGYCNDCFGKILAESK